MNRNYTTGMSNSVELFTGIEIEHTPAYGMKTLFVVGTNKNSDELVHISKEFECEHIYLGANHSFHPDTGLGDKFSSYDHWIGLITGILSFNVLTTLDFDVKYAEWVSRQEFINNNLFIPQISVKIPNIQKFNYNTMVKVDDIDFNATNPGVWCHRLHNLKNENLFTSWTKYTKDEPL